MRVSGQSVRLRFRSYPHSYPLFSSLPDLSTVAKLVRMSRAYTILKRPPLRKDQLDWLEALRADDGVLPCPAPQWTPEEVAAAQEHRCNAALRETKKA